MAQQRDAQEAPHLEPLAQPACGTMEKKEAEGEVLRTQQL
jgi:hypothetical protein